MAPTLNGTPQTRTDNGLTAGTKTTVASPSTVSANDIVIILVHHEVLSTVGSYATTTITDNLGSPFTYNLRKRLEWQDSGGNYNTLEEWYAVADATHTGSTYGVQAAADVNTDGDEITVFTVSGCSTASPFDSTIGPAFATSGTTSTNEVTGVSTTDANVFNIAVTAFGGTTYVASLGSLSSPWVQIQSNVGDGSSHWSGMESYYNAGNALSNATINFGASINNWAVLVDALSADVPLTGTVSATETTDTASAHGGLLGGHMASTEATDTAYFYQAGPPTGVWGSTEAKDTASAAGLVPILVLLDGYATNANVEVAPNYYPLTSANVTLSTSNPNDVIVLAVACGGFWNAQRVTGVTDTAGLTWKRRNRRWQVGGYKTGEAGAPAIANDVNQGLDIEIWWAHAPTVLTNDVITATFAGLGVGGASLIAFGVVNANYLAPWDTHTQAGGYVDNIGNINYFPAQAQLTTNASSAFLFGIHADQTADSGVAKAPWTFVAGVSSGEHIGYASYESFAYQTVSTPQSATDVPFGAPYAGGIVFSAASVMFDSIVQANETGTAEEIVWFWDGGYIHGSLAVNSTTTSLALSYSPVNFNLMVLVQVLIQSASGTGEVTSITEGSGEARSPGFERRSRVVNGNLASEVWWAWMEMPTTRPSNDQITINTSGLASGDVLTAQIFGLGGSTGSFNLGNSFWDNYPTLPATNSAAASSPSPHITDINTESLSVLAVAFTANNSVPEPGYVEPYVTLVQDPPATVVPIMSFSSVAPPAYLGFEYFYSFNLVENETAEFLVSPEPNGWLMIADAIPVGPPQPPNGIWGSHENADRFTNNGHFEPLDDTTGWFGFVPLQCTVHPTDQPDEFTNNGAFHALGPGWYTGWVGDIPVPGTWHSTEHADIPSLYGWVIGFGSVTGQIVAHDHRDYVSLSDATSVTGKLQTTDTKDRWSSNGFLIPKANPVPARKRRLLLVT